MQMNDVLEKIRSLRQNRGWTEYELATRSGLPQSTISSWYRKNLVPSVASLRKICDALGITLSQLFSEAGEPVSLTDTQEDLLRRWNRLGESQQAALLAVIDLMGKDQ